MFLGNKVLVNKLYEDIANLVTENEHLKSTIKNKDHEIKVQDQKFILKGCKKDDIGIISTQVEDTNTKISQVARSGIHPVEDMQRIWHWQFVNVKESWQ